jgi:hypothetical protein
LSVSRSDSAQGGQWIGILGTGLLYAVIAVSAWIAYRPESQPPWFYAALRGLAITGSVVAVVTAYKMKGFWWWLFIWGHAAIGGVYMFAEMGRSQWRVVNLATALFEGFFAITCFAIVAMILASRKVRARVEKDLPKVAEVVGAPLPGSWTMSEEEAEDLIQRYIDVLEEHEPSPENIVSDSFLPAPLHVVKAALRQTYQNSPLNERRQRAARTMYLQLAYFAPDEVDLLSEWEATTVAD